MDAESNIQQDITQLRDQMVEMQSQLAFQEDVISALDAVVTRQQRQIENLQEMWAGQKSHLEHISNELEKGLVEARPPHY